MKKIFLLSLFTPLIVTFSFAQNVAINADASLPNSSAMLDVKSTNKGILIPRMTSAQRTAITTPAEGLMVYQTDSPGEFFIFKAGSWKILATVAGTNSQLQYNDNGTLGGAAKAGIDGGYLNIGSTVNTPSAPAAGVNIFTQLRTGKNMLSQVSPSGTANSFQPFMGQKRVSWWSAVGNSITVSVDGFNNNVMGTSTPRIVSTVDLFNSTKRLGFVSSAFLGSIAGTRHGALQYFLGTAPGMGGFFYIARFGLSSLSTISTQRSFIGFAGQANALPNADPSTNVNIIGFGNDASDLGWRFMYNDASGVATKVPIPGNFSTTNFNSDIIEIRLYCAPGSTTVYYSIEVLGGGSYFEGSVNSDLPVNTLLSPQIWTNNGSTGSAAGIDVLYQYMETEY